MARPEAGRPRDPGRSARADDTGHPAPGGPRTPPAWRSPARLRAGALGLGAALCLLGAWLSVPRARPGAVPPDPPLRAVLVDASASVTARRPRWRGHVLRVLWSEAVAAREAGEELLVVRYDEAVERLFGPGDPRDLERRLAGGDGDGDGGGEDDGDARGPLDPAAPGGRDLGSDLAGALELAAARVAAPGRRAGRVVVVGDLRAPTGPVGEAGAGRAAEALARLRAAGVRLERRPLSVPEGRGAAVLDLRAPRRVPRGAPVAVRLELALGLPAGEVPGTADGPTLELRAAGPGPFEPRAHALRPPAGLVPDDDGVLRWWQVLELEPLPPGTWDLTATVRLPGDRRRDDDTARARLRVEGSLQVVVWTPPAREAVVRRAIERLAAASPGLGFDLPGPERRTASLRDADVLWTVDLPARELPRADLATLVRGGGGWLFSGGESLLGGWDEQPPAGSTAELLPLAPAPPPGGPREVWLVVDGSGSMSGEPFRRVRRASAALVTGLAGSDRLQVRLFTTVLHPPLLRAAGDDPEGLRAALVELLRARNAGGSTDVNAALRGVVEARRDSDVRALVLLLTDGHSTDGTRLDGRLRDRLDDGGAELVVLVVEGGAQAANRRGLSAFLREGEELVEAGDLEQLERLLLEQVQDERSRDTAGARWVAARGSAGGESSGDVVAEVARVWSVLEPPRVRRHLDLAARPGAEVLLESLEGRPLLALGAAGEGWVAATGLSLVDSASGPALPARTDLWGPLLRALAGTGARSLTGPRAAVRGGRLELEGAEALPLELRAELRRRDPAGDLADLGVGRPGTGEELLAELELAPDAGASGADPRALRGSPWPPLGPEGRPLDLVAGEPLWLRLDPGPDADPVPAVPLFAPLPAELGRSVPIAWPAGSGDEDPRRGDPPRGPHPLGPVVLGLGGLLLGLAGLARPRRGGAGAPWPAPRG